eukprot:COSAG01_NODE_1534_length_9989_cov_4.712235_5_plen_69_part_00
MRRDARFFMLYLPRVPHATDIHSTLSFANYAHIPRALTLRLHRMDTVVVTVPPTTFMALFRGSSCRPG